MLYTPNMNRRFQTFRAFVSSDMITMTSINEVAWLGLVKLTLALESKNITNSFDKR